MTDQYFEERDIYQVLNAGSTSPRRRKICGSFLYEDTTTLLFSRTNYGKSLFAFQFAWAAATGSDFDPCAALLNECEPMKVLVVDLELDPVDLFERHKETLDLKHPWASNLVYLHEKLDQNMMIGFPLLEKIEQYAVKHQAKLVVIDNLSKLLPDALRPDVATIVVSILNKIRKVTGCSVLVIGHTTKGNPRVCIQPTDYYGSAMLQNFFHELTFLDRAKDGNYFLCHSKTKHADVFTDVVPVFSRGQHQRHGFGFTFLNLQQLSMIQLPAAIAPNQGTRSRNLDDYKKEILILIAGGCSQSDIAKAFNVNQSSISRILAPEG